VTAVRCVRPLEKSFLDGLREVYQGLDGLETRSLGAEQTSIQFCRLLCDDLTIGLFDGETLRVLSLNSCACLIDQLLAGTTEVVGPLRLLLVPATVTAK